MERWFSQEDLARAAGITYSSLSKVWAGYVQNPRVVTVQEIAKALKVTIDDLVKEYHLCNSIGTIAVMRIERAGHGSVILS